MADVLVVGIGGAGCEMLSEVAQFVDREGTSDRYRLVGIDSDQRALTERAPEQATRYHLQADQKMMENAWRNLDYLQDFQDFSGVVPATGTERYRPLGRFLVDSDADAARLESLLENEFKACAGGDDAIQVWVVTSLGGGTGSGAAPLVMAVLANCQRRLELEADLHGLGSLPRLDELSSHVANPVGMSEHYANAYTALTELRRLMNLDGETTYPLEIGVNAVQKGIRTDSIKIKENPFDSYWLVGAPEPNGLEQNIFEHANRLVARLIHYVGTTTTRDWLREGCLYSVAGVTIDAPLSEIDRYRRLGRKVEELESKIAALRSDIDELENAAESIEAVLHADRSAINWTDEESAKSFGPFGADLVTGCIRIINRLVADTPHADRFNDVAESFASNRGNSLPNKAPVKVLVRYLFILTALEQTGEAIDSHQFPAYLRQLQSKWLSGENDEVLSSEEEISEWQCDVISALRDHHHELKERNDQSMIPAFLSTMDDRLNDLDAELDKAEQLSDIFNSLEQFESFLREERTHTRRQLNEILSDLESRATERRDEQEAVRSELAEHSRRRSRLGTALRNPENDGRRVQIPIQSPEAANQNYENLVSLISNGVVDDAVLREALERALPLLEEPVEDLRDGTFGRHGRLGVLVDDSNRDLVQRLLTNPTEELGLIHSRRYQHGYDLVPWIRSGNFFMLACYRSIELGQTTEFSTVHSCFTDPEVDISSLFGESLKQGISDEELHRRFAYPELVGFID